MSFLDRLLGDDRPRQGEEDPERVPHWTVPAKRPGETGSGDPGPCRISLFAGNLTRAPADGICTSTNPRLSLMGGTGAAVLQRAGWAVKRECESILEHHREETGRETLEPGTAWTTTAGALPFQGIVHCVASDDSHRSSPEIVTQVVESALNRAMEAGWESLAMPPFGTGHAHLDLDRAVTAMARQILASRVEVEEVVLVIQDPSAVPGVRQVMERELEDPQL
ncbi:MAG: macro domain-containing protein [Thermoanaerobaculia bacterium]|nr:macro domain-containing protein [Thermoanaerobaculia bacterium]